MHKDALGFFAIEKFDLEGNRFSGILRKQHSIMKVKTESEGAKAILQS